jgi:putative ABC transport system permease protein
MYKNYLLITFRGMAKNKLFIIINVFGMGVAIACSIVAFLAYKYDDTFDAVHKNRKNIYRVSAVREFESDVTRFGYTPLALADIVDNTFQDVNESTRFSHSSSNFKRENDLFAANLTYVDPGFFQMFTFNFVEGNPSSLNDKTSVFISEDMAIRLFNTPKAAFGKTISQVYGTEVKETKIAGIFSEPPPNSSFYRKGGSAYMNFENYKDENIDTREDDWKKQSTLFIQIDDPNRVAGVKQQLQQYIANNNRVREDFQLREFGLDQLTTMAHRDRAGDVRSWTWGAPPLSAITGAMVMAMLLLLIACFNLTNTAIAISSRRLKEIGIRKVMGSRRMQLVMQFIGETTFICFLSLLVAIGLADVLLAGWNMMTSDNIHLSSRYNDVGGFLLFLVGVLIFTGIVAGSYPAFYISKFEPVNILKGKLKFGGTNYFTRILLGLQFTFSLIAIVNAIGFLQNARYQQKYDLGFDMRGSVIATVKNQGEYDTYRTSLLTNPKIVSVAGAGSGIFSNHVHEPVKHESRQVEVDIIDVGDNYIQTMDLKILEGRDFIKDSQTDQKESIIVTQKMAKLFGWEKPLGQEVIWKDSIKLYVIGVVKDVHTHGLWREMEPMMIRYVLPDKYSQIVVSTKPEDVSSVNAFMNEQWNKIFPGRLYTGNMLVSQLNYVTELNFSLVYMYAFLGVIALLLSATGLFTLVSLNVIRRIKEIGVRKILGASVSSITRTINTEFIVILVSASCLGTWVSYTMSTIIMGSIWKYYQSVNFLTFAVSIGLIFTVSALTIGYKVFNVARMNPVKALRDE